MSLKTIVFYLISVLVAVAGAYGYADFKPGPEVEGAAFLVVALINLYLHWQASQKASSKPDQPEADK